MAKKSKKQKSLRPELVRITEYFVSGGAQFWSGYLIIVFMTPVIGLWWANLLGNGVGITINFFLERYWVFAKNKEHSVTKASGKFIVFTGVNLLLNYVILRVLQQKFGVPVAIGQFIAAGFFTAWNYIGYRFWVFKGADRKRKTRHHA